MTCTVAQEAGSVPGAISVYVCIFLSCFTTQNSRNIILDCNLPDETSGLLRVSGKVLKGAVVIA